MVKSAPGVLILFLSIAWTGCDRKSTHTTDEARQDDSKTNNFGFLKIDSKYESTKGGANRIDLYTPQDRPTPGSLEDLCKSQKKDVAVVGFYYLVVFDQRENAVFPNNPFTSLYGVDEEPQKHIIAIFTYNTVNGFSQLSTYKPNMWNGKPVTYEIN
jgi:hypothetical protein